MANPVVRHGYRMKVLLRYLRLYSDMLITYQGNSKQGIQLVSYSDTDYAADKSDRKSTMGQVFILGGGPISWASRKQRLVLVLITEAEYMALSKYSRQAV